MFYVCIYIHTILIETNICQYYCCMHVAHVVQSVCMKIHAHSTAAMPVSYSSSGNISPLAPRCLASRSPRPESPWTPPGPGRGRWSNRPTWQRRALARWPQGWLGFSVWAENVEVLAVGLLFPKEWMNQLENRKIISKCSEMGISTRIMS